MKKFIKILIIIVVIVTITTILGYNVLMSGEMVSYKEDVLDGQEDNEKYYSSYGFTLDNPNVVVNPYDVSPLTALVMFDLDDVEDIVVTVEGKDEDTTYSYKVEGKRNNYIPIYGLYSDKENKVIIKVGKKSKEINIKTGSLEEFSIIDNYSDNLISFVDMDSYSYAVDKNGDVRWYLEGYGGKLDVFSNGHFLLHSNNSVGSGYYSGIVEIDVLGKIYSDYIIDNGGYKGAYSIIDDNNIYVASNGYVNLLNLQSGSVINSIDIGFSCNYIDYGSEGVKCSNDIGNYLLNIDSGKVLDIDTEDDYSNIYINDMDSLGNYKIGKGVRYNSYSKTDTVNKRVWLFNYNDMDLDKYDIDIYQEVDRIVVNGKFSSDSEVYVILDGIGGKKIYRLDREDDNYYKYISKVGLSGKYTIYFKINDKLYKTKYYVKV
jgi:hypothetical protein